MYPILYDKTETDFTHNGLGILRDTISAIVTEELNGQSELTLEYDMEGFLSSELGYDMIIKAKANDEQDLQLFRIYAFEKDQEEDKITVNAQHITYDLSGNFVESFEVDNVTTSQAMTTLQSKMAYATPFTLSSDATTISSTKLYHMNPLQMLAGVEGSILDNWGGEIERDNFKLIMHKRRGADNGVLVAWRKNLTGLTAKFDISNVVTRIYPFYTKEDGTVVTIPGKYVDSPHINDYPVIRILEVDYSQDDDVTDQASLIAKSKTYFDSGDYDLPDVSLDITFESIWQTEEYKRFAILEKVVLGDTITVRNERMGIDMQTRIIKTEYDCIAEKNATVSAGKLQADFTDTVADVESNAEKGISDAQDAAYDATNVFYQVKNNAAVTIGNSPSVILEKAFNVDETTVGVIAFASQVNVTDAGYLNAYFMLDGNQLDPEVKQTVVAGWQTVGFSFLLSQIQKGNRKLSLYMQMPNGGAGTIDTKDAELYIQLGGMLGTDDSGSDSGDDSGGGSVDQKDFMIVSYSNFMRNENNELPSDKFTIPFAGWDSGIPLPTMDDGAGYIEFLDEDDWYYGVIIIDPGAYLYMLDGNVYVQGSSWKFYKSNDNWSSYTLSETNMPSDSLPSYIKNTKDVAKSNIDIYTDFNKSGVYLKATEPQPTNYYNFTVVALNWMLDYFKENIDSPLIDKQIQYPTTENPYVGKVILNNVTIIITALDGLNGNCLDFNLQVGFDFNEDFSIYSGYPFYVNVDFFIIGDYFVQFSKNNTGDEKAFSSVQYSNFMTNNLLPHDVFTITKVHNVTGLPLPDMSENTRFIESYTNDDYSYHLIIFDNNESFMYMSDGKVYVQGSSWKRYEQNMSDPQGSYDLVETNNSSEPLPDYLTDTNNIIQSNTNIYTDINKSDVYYEANILMTSDYYAVTDKALKWMLDQFNNTIDSPYIDKQIQYPSTDNPHVGIVTLNNVTITFTALNGMGGNEGYILKVSLTDGSDFTKEFGIISTAFSDYPFYINEDFFIMGDYFVQFYKEGQQQADGGDDGDNGDGGETHL